MQSRFVLTKPTLALQSSPRLARWPMWSRRGHGARRRCTLSSTLSSVSTTSPPTSRPRKRSRRWCHGRGLTMTRMRRTKPSSRPTHSAATADCSPSACWRTTWASMSGPSSRSRACAATRRSKLAALLLARQTAAPAGASWRQVTF
eukprot:Amastigsp_a175455_117.p2 type:complete len:146 gc:universal Amastigsp_a175455_117:739-302(-)